MTMGAWFIFCFRFLRATIGLFGRLLTGSRTLFFFLPFWLLLLALLNRNCEILRLTLLSGCGRCGCCGGSLALFLSICLFVYICTYIILLFCCFSTGILFCFLIFSSYSSFLVFRTWANSGSGSVRCSCSLFLLSFWNNGLYLIWTGLLFWFYYRPRVLNFLLDIVRIQTLGFTFGLLALSLWLSHINFFNALLTIPNTIIWTRYALVFVKEVSFLTGHICDRNYIPFFLVWDFFVIHKPSRLQN